MSPLRRLTRRRRQTVLVVTWIMVGAIGLSVIATVLAVTLH